MGVLHRGLAILGFGIVGGVIGASTGCAVGEGDAGTLRAQAANMELCAETMTQERDMASYICGMTLQGDWSFDKFTEDAQEYAGDLKKEAKDLRSDADKEDESGTFGRYGVIGGAALGLGLGVVVDSEQFKRAKVQAVPEPDHQ